MEINMEQMKLWYLFKGMIGFVFGILVFVGVFFGYEVDLVLVEDLIVQVFVVVIGVISLVVFWGWILVIKKIGK